MKVRFAVLSSESLSCTDKDRHVLGVFGGLPVGAASFPLVRRRRRGRRGVGWEANANGREDNEGD